MLLPQAHPSVCGGVGYVPGLGLEKWCCEDHAGIHCLAEFIQQKEVSTEDSRPGEASLGDGHRAGSCPLTAYFQPSPAFRSAWQGGDLLTGAVAASTLGTKGTRWALAFWYCLLSQASPKQAVMVCLLPPATVARYGVIASSAPPPPGNTIGQRCRCQQGEKVAWCLWVGDGEELSAQTGVQLLQPQPASIHRRMLI